MLNLHTMAMWGAIIRQISQSKVKSVTDAPIKFGLIALALGVLSAIFTDKNWVTIFVFSIAVILILIGTIFYGFFALQAPEYLRSETFQTQKQAMELLGDNDRSENQNVAKITEITNWNTVIDSNKNDNPLLN